MGLGMEGTVAMELAMVAMVAMAATVGLGGTEWRSPRS